MFAPIPKLRCIESDLRVLVYCGDGASNGQAMWGVATFHAVMADDSECDHSQNCRNSNSTHGRTCSPASSATATTAARAVHD